jgi:membrane protease subunit HflK
MKKDASMASNNGNGPRGGPWGQPPNAAPDLEEALRRGQDRLKQIMPGGGPVGLLALAALALLALGAWTAYYTVPSDSVAVVQRFGKYLKEVPPGLHFKLPLGVDAATIVPVKRQLKQ